MKRKACLAALAVCIAAGCVRLWDLLTNSEAQTGFVTAGSVWLRYGVLALLVVGIFLLAKFARAGVALEQMPLPLPPLVTVLAAVAVWSGILGLQYAAEQFARPTTSLGHAQGGAALLVFALTLRLVFAVSLLLFGVWCALLSLRKNPVLRPQKGIIRMTGFWGAVAFCVLPLLRYAENPASVHRILRILPICSALAAMLFVVKLLGTLCMPLTAARRGALAAVGLYAFLLCACIEGPQLFWQMAVSKPSMLECWTGGTLALLGCVGGVTALAVSEA